MNSFARSLLALAVLSAALSLGIWVGANTGRAVNVGDGAQALFQARYDLERGNRQRVAYFVGVAVASDQSETTLFLAGEILLQIDEFELATAVFEQVLASTTSTDGPVAQRARENLREIKSRRTLLGVPDKPLEPSK
jgi:hypothetical protein